MAGNVEFDDDDIEHGHNTNQVQTFATSKSEQVLIVEDKEKKQNPYTWNKLLGLEELVSVNVWRASFAELIGTAVLVFSLDGIVISSIQTDTNTPNLIIALTAAIIVAILLIATFPISGGHINPIISFSAALTGVCSLTRAVIYIFMQYIGGILGTLALKAVVKSTIEDTFSLGGCTVSVVTTGENGVPVVVGLGISEALWLEIFCSFVFLFSTIWMAFDHRQARALGHVLVLIMGIVLGLLVFVSTTLTAQKGYSGTGLNPRL